MRIVQSVGLALLLTGFMCEQPAQTTAVDPLIHELLPELPSALTAGALRDSVPGITFREYKGYSIRLGANSRHFEWAEMEFDTYEIEPGSRARMLRAGVYASQDTGGTVGDHYRERLTTLYGVPNDSFCVEGIRIRSWALEDATVLLQTVRHDSATGGGVGLLMVRERIRPESVFLPSMVTRSSCF